MFITPASVTLHISAPNTTIYSIEYNLVIFNSFNPSFRYADGSITQSYLYSLTRIEIPRHNIEEMRTYLTGTSSFDISVLAPLSIHT
jgi:hypothetical protein